jgi:methyltransferase
MPNWYPWLLGLAALQRMRELLVSRRLERDVVRGRQAAAATFPFMVALHVALFAAPICELATLRRRPRATLLWVGVLGGATALRWWSIRALGGAWNVRAVVPSDLRPVTAGPYRFVRHPNYVAVALEFLALPMAGGAWLSALVLSALNGLVLLDRVREEERLLARVPGYEQAFRGRARFIPGIFRTS